MIQDALPPAAGDETDLVRLALIVVGAVAAHIAVRLVKRAGDRWLTPRRRHPKLVTVLSLAVSAATFVIWFVALGLFLGELGVDLTAYFATATVIGLAVGFGSQGLVQDVVIGLTLIFSDAMDIGDMVEVSGQVGQVERIGLRFTTLTNFLGQTVFIPNRNIAVVGRYRRGVVRAYLDVQVPEGRSPEATGEEVLAIARAFRAQHAAAILDDPVLVEGGAAPASADAAAAAAGAPGPGAAWRFVRLKLRLWPGQQALVETTLRQRIVAHMKTVDEKYADWMVPVTYRVT